MSPFVPPGPSGPKVDIEAWAWSQLGTEATSHLVAVAFLGESPCVFGNVFPNEMAESFVFWRNLGFKLNKLTASKTSNAVSVKMHCFLAELDVHNDIIYHNIYI